MAMKLLKTLSMLTSVIMMLVLTACGTGATKETASPKASAQAAKEKISLKIMEKYTDPAEKGPVDYALEAVKKEFPNVEITIEPDPRDNWQKLKVYAAGGNLPDMFHLDGATKEVFKKSNSLLVLDDYLKDTQLEAKMKPEVYASLKEKDGHVYYIRVENSENGLMYINKELFQQNNIKIPDNYEEFLAAVKAFKEKDILPMAIFAKEKWPGVTFFDMILSREIPTGYKGIEDGTLKGSDPAILKAAKKEAELVKAGLISKSAFTSNYDDAFALFTSGKAAMLPNGSWVLKDAYDKMGDKLDFLPPSIFADKDKAEASKVNAVGGGGAFVGIGVAANTKNKELAVKFAAAFALKLNEGTTIKNGAFSSVLKETPPFEGQHNPLQKKYGEYVKNIKEMSYFDWEITDAKVKTSIEDLCEKLLGGFITPEEFVEQLDKVGPAK